MTKEERHQLQIREEHFFSGPLPGPEILANYERVLPGLADRIVGMAERQSAHRQELEKAAVLGEQQRAGRGQSCALIVALCGLVVAGLCGFSGQQVAASIIGGIDLVGLVGVFIYGSAARRSYLAKRAQPSQGQGSEGAGADK